MFDVGRVCVKIAGRDAGQKCVIVQKLEGKYVLIDGMTRRRKCNTLHLEPLDQTLEISSESSHEDVAAAFKNMGLEVKSTTPKQRMTRLKAARKAKEKPAEDKKAKKPKAEKKEKPAKTEKKAKEEKKE